VGWDVTNACNLRCRHCYASAGERKKNELTLEEAKDIIDDLSRLGTVLIALSGGEPLVRKDIYEIIHYIKNKNIELFVNSNGTLITKAVAKRLRDAGVRHLEVSIDGLEETHDSIRGKGSFKRAVKGFENSRDAGIETGILTTVFKRNYKETEDLIKYFYDLGSVGIGFLRFKPVGRGEEHHEWELTPNERKKFLEVVYRMKVKMRNDFHIKAETPVSILVAMKTPEIMKEHPYATELARGCPGGIISCHIRYNGDVSSCAQMGLVAGNVRKNSIGDLWNNSELFKKLRTRNYNGKCGKCEHKNICGGCRSCAYIYTGDVLGEDKGCWL
jgi:radical SAM protein with 4Fe4S-binding SPASM domain